MNKYMLRHYLITSSLVLFASLGASVCHAQGLRHFEVGGINWRFPSADVMSPPVGGSHIQAVTLRLNLPEFTPFDPKAFKNDPADASEPVVSITISDDSKALLWQKLLDSLGFQAELDCPSCGADSSLGGKVYSNRIWNPRFIPLKDDDTGLAYNLYFNVLPSGATWFAICRFRTDGSAMPCEVREMVGGAMVTYEFPPEYLARALWIDSRVQVFLADHRLPKRNAAPADVAPLPDPTCWSPVPGSPGAETIPLRVGPEQWHIPEAYAATFGNDQTTNPQINGFDIFLKLPDLEPLGPDDRSPFDMLGFGPYVGIFFTYDQEQTKMFDLITKDDRGLPALSNLPSTYIGQNRFIDYEERYAGSIDRKIYISSSPQKTESSFPPKSFDCTLFKAGESAFCQFTIREKQTINSSDILTSQYTIEYSFLRDYFSQLLEINKCVQKLYETFSAGNK